MDLIYPDYNCFQRPFDNPLDVRIQIEALACQELFCRAEAHEVELVWSFVHQDETIVCPFPDRKAEAFRLSSLCARRQGPVDSILQKAGKLSAEQNISGKDALRLAAALEIRADIFLTCDDRLLHRAGRSQLDIELLNPADYIREERKP